MELVSSEGPVVLSPRNAEFDVTWLNRHGHEVIETGTIWWWLWWLRGWLAAWSGLRG
jgi:hypothetical protein